MAGSGKTTPRQRMVNMMYLVLTAMLALQVKNTVLDKFIDIDDSLQHSVSEARKDNQKILTSIEKSIEKRGSKSEDLTVLEDAKEVISETNDVLGMIEDFRKEMVDAAGGYDEEGHYAKADEEDAVALLALGANENKSGKAYELEEKLNAYVEKIRKIDPDLKIEKLALEASDIARYKGEDGQANKDFAELNFEETPMVAALAVLSDLQSKVSRVENKALSKLSEKVGAKDLIFDEIIAVVAPESRYVTAGTPYKAKVYVAAHSTAASPEMSSSIGNIKVDDSGAGDLQFTASASNFDERGYAKGVWTGSVKLTTPKGDTTLKIKEEYTIVKPNIKVSATAVKALYRNCGNDLDIQVPELGAAYNPEFDIQGGSIQKTSRRGVVKVLPTSRNVIITVKNSGSTIGTEKFRVKKVPKPDLQVWSGGRQMNLAIGGASPRSLEVKAIPDEDFAEFLPNDARYRVTQMEVILARRNNQVDKKVVNGSKVNLTSFAQQARPGDRIVIDVKRVERMNYRNEREVVNCGLQIFQYNITR